MSAESCSVSLVNQLTISMSKNVPKAYYRSKLFIAPYTTNPLIAAAGPLFSLLERLSISSVLPAINLIRDNIEHELHAFQSKLSVSDYSQDLMAIAYYLLCATIDEMLAKSYLRLYGENTEFKAFTPLTSNKAEPQSRFFEIVNSIKESPNQYLDLIELAYYCLIAGFEGEQHFHANGRQNLDHLIEELYLLIQKHRVNKPYKLDKETHLPKTLPKNRKPILIAGLVGISIFLSVLGLSHLLLENKAKNVLFGHFQQSMMDH
ncbi:DotU family type IV/VI secretion system protein [Legionella israelensis]|uniref:DotU family type IV/VI secretion system protein n=1 Tax=Legionella israelensis TaxID=454 RepID=A0AAX1EDQ9_9GAMM|nr:type IVB secretion system protein IcmH/DotU [Legionella israelensis]QBR83251.1 DotU family type IV/VI secretion system protein [Legionella israelensis]